MSITEKLIGEQFKTAIELYKNLQLYILDSSDMELFCKSLFDKNITEYNEMLFSMY